MPSVQICGRYDMPTQTLTSRGRATQLSGDTTALTTGKSYFVSGPQQPNGPVEVQAVHAAVRRPGGKGLVPGESISRKPPVLAPDLGIYAQTPALQGRFTNARKNRHGNWSQMEVEGTKLRVEEADGDTSRKALREASDIKKQGLQISVWGRVVGNTCFVQAVNAYHP